MILFIMYMSGNSVAIVPILLTCILVMRPVRSLMTIKSKFSASEINGSDALLQKTIYSIGNLICLALALCKCQSMGLLPPNCSDLIEHLKRFDSLERGVNTASM